MFSRIYFIPTIPQGQGETKRLLRMRSPCTELVTDIHHFPHESSCLDVPAPGRLFLHPGFSKVNLLFWSLLASPVWWPAESRFSRSKLESSQPQHFAKHCLSQRTRPTIYPSLGLTCSQLYKVGDDP